jgi:hypothetical protein
MAGSDLPPLKLITRFIPTFTLNLRPCSYCRFDPGPDGARMAHTAILGPQS